MQQLANGHHVKMFVFTDNRVSLRPPSSDRYIYFNYSSKYNLLE